MNMDRYRILFVQEGREHLSELARILTAVEGESDALPLIDESFRHIHSVKGMSASMGYEPITTLAHGLEDQISALRAARATPQSSLVDLFLRVVDHLSAQIVAIADQREPEPFDSLVQELKTAGLSDRVASPDPSHEDVEEDQVVEADAPAHDTAAGERISTVAGSEVSEFSAPITVRVRVDILDGLLDGIGELLIVREQLLSVLSAATDPELQGILDGLESRIRELRERVLQLRMTPLRTLTERYPRIVRDLAKQLDKSVQFRVDGDEIELDRAVLEALDTPFVHTLRNAIDHGIENRNQRLESGKAAVATLVFRASRDRDSVLVTIEDDGEGLDPEKLKRTAISRGMLHPDRAEVLTRRETLFLICLPGFSTKDQVSDVSGRGVGMDVVRAQVEDLNGSIEIESEVGLGTRFIFRLPLTVAIIHALVVQVSGRRFAIPVAKIADIREFNDDHDGFQFEGRRVMIYGLAELLGLSSSVPPTQVVVVDVGQDVAGVPVESVVGYHEVVVKPLGEPLDRMEWYSGATILGDGEPLLILDLPNLVRSQWR